MPWHRYIVLSLPFAWLGGEDGTNFEDLDPNKGSSTFFVYDLSRRIKTLTLNNFSLELRTIFHSEGLSIGRKGEGEG
jgi:hypothetical protein